MKYSDIGYQNDTINNALQHLYMMNEKFNVHFPSLKENLEYYKNKKECNHLKLKFIFYCTITFLLIINIIAYYNQSLLVFIPFIIIASLWSIIYYVYNHRIINLPNFLYYLFLINFVINIIFLLYLPLGNNDFTIIPERIVITLKVFLCVIFSINYFKFSKQIEKEYFFINILEKFENDNQIVFEQQDEESEKELTNEIQEAEQEEVLNQSPPEEIKQKGNRSSKNKTNKRKTVKNIDDIFNLFRSIMPPEEAKKIPFKEFFYDYIAKEYSEHDFVGYNFNLRFKEGKLFRIYKNGKEKHYEYNTLEQYFCKYCKLAQL